MFGKVITSTPPKKHVGLSRLIQPVTRTIFGKVCLMGTSKRPVRTRYRRVWHHITATLYLDHIF